MSIALPCPPPTYCATSNPQVGLGGYATSILTKVTPSGRAYHRRRRNLRQGRRASEDDASESYSAAQLATRLAQETEEQALAAYRASLRNVKSFLDLTYYQQLGLTPFDVSPDDIRKAYRRVLLEHHPDKTGQTENDPNYLSVQRAFTTFMDPKLKRAYDSQCDFDETIPSGKENILQHDAEGKQGVCFYALYGPVFERNARFSEKRPVPLLGGDDLDMHSVHKFYEFWNTFDSWRDFTHNAENDLDTAGGRYEKRDMMKKNEAAAKKQKKKEYQRLANLIDRALANDPRIRRVKMAQKAAKAKAIQDKEQAKADAEKLISDAAEAKAKAEAEVLEKAKADSKAAKFAREKQKKIIRKAKKAFREALASVTEQKLIQFLDVEEIEFLCDSLELTQLQDITKDLSTQELNPLVSLWTTLRGSDYADKKKSKF